MLRAILYKVIKEDLTGMVAIQQRPEVNEGMSPVCTTVFEERAFQREGTASGKNQESYIFKVSEKSREASVAEAQSKPGPQEVWSESQLGAILESCR